MDIEKQRKLLAGVPVDIVVATPGRLLDFQQRHDLILSKTEVMIIDEADRMLDMGFYPDVRKIIHSTPPGKSGKRCFFSATLTEEVTRLAAQWTINPVMVEIEPDQVARRYGGSDLLHLDGQPEISPCSTTSSSNRTWNACWSSATGKTR